MKENNYELVKFEKTFENSAISIPDTMKATSKKLLEMYVKESSNKKELALICLDLKNQAEKANISFKDFIKAHFSGIYSDSTLYAYAQTAERFSGCSKIDNYDFSEIWEIVPISKLVLMKSIKKSKLNKSDKFSVIHFIMLLGCTVILNNNTEYNNREKEIENLEYRYRLYLEDECLEDALEIRKAITELQNKKLSFINIPHDINEQSDLYYEKGLEDLCLESDSAIKSKIKLYNLYSDFVEPEKAEPEKAESEKAESEKAESEKAETEKTEPEKAKTTAEIISDILAMIDVLESTAAKDGETLPKGAISKFKLALQNRNK